jgi:glycosyltransferase involved in cell wall biosynthesis
LNDGEQAVLTPLDPESVAGAIDSVLTDPGLARRLGAGGRALATAELDPARCTARIDELYRSVTEAAR